MRRNILYIVLELFAGGLENGIVNLINNSSERFNHIICCLRKKGVFESRLKKDVKVIELNMKYGNDYSLPYKLFKIIKNERIDIIRAFNEEPYFYSFLPAKLTRTPTIYYNGGRTFPEKKKRLIIEQLLGNFADRVIAPSVELKNYLSFKVGISDKLIEVIYNGADLNRFSTSIDIGKKRRELNLFENHLVIGTVGRLMEQKDIPTFLRIAKKLAVFRKDIAFIIAGDGMLKGELEQIAREYSIDRIVQFLGVRDDIEDIYKVMDIFLLTSRWEGMSNVLLEAMASGKAVLSTDVEGVREIISDGEDGYILKVGDVNGFVQKIMELDQKRRSELGRKAFHKISKKFSIQKMVRDYETLYIDILNN